MIAIFIYSCANIAMPPGGPKDTQPPKEVKSMPPNYSKNFNIDKARIYFDEFVTLNDVTNQVIISPPLEEMPEFSLRGRSLVIEFMEDFKENTTYTIFLGSAISDITETNILTNFEYVFSTGNTIDSLSIHGKVINAFDNKPEKDILVMLYLQTYDSIPYKEKPYYITRTGESGEFALNNLGEGKYKIFALRDANSNYIYDLPNEAIAFSDSLIESEYFKMFQNDSLVSDSLINSEIINDTLKPFSYQLSLFEEPDTLQRLARAYSPLEGKLVFIFLKSTINPHIRLLNHDFKTSWYIEDFNSTNDTLTYWITNFERDTLLLEVSDNGFVLDTTEIIIVKHKKKKEKLKDKGEKLSKKLVLVSNARRSFNYYDPLIVTSSYPLTDFDFSEILLIEEEDTLKAKLVFDDQIKRMIRLDYEFKENTTYRLFIPDSAFTDIINRSNDTVLINFRTTSDDDYGILMLKLKVPGTDDQYIIQLLNEKDKVLQQQIVTASTEIIYKHLKPAKYLIKAILDNNINGKWDTGNYLNKLQPEKVYFFPAKINIRSKWEIEEEWKL